jgi:hypothetical protein
MEVQFARALQDICKGALDDSRENLRFALGVIADVMLEIFNALESDLHLARQERSSVSHVVRIARRAVAVLDACQLLASSLFTIPVEHCFHELELRDGRNYESLSGVLHKRIRAAVNERPFVYVVWNRRAKRFIYVGAGQCDAKQGLACAFASRRKLLDALQVGSVLTLICPRQMSASLASSVETALLSVLESQRIFPELNDRPRMPVRAEPRWCLDEIGQLVGEIGRR